MEEFEGPCFGGPKHGQTISVRFPKGFLLVDKQANRCWIYDWTGKIFSVRDEEPMEVLLDGPKNRYRAAEEFDYDVVAI